jgi:hypothetical protein
LNSPGTAFQGDDNVHEDAFFFTKVGAVIFVIDAQDEPYDRALAYAKREEKFLMSRILTQNLK